MQTPIPAIFMRGGTSRGLYFNRADLPVEGAHDEVGQEPGGGEPEHGEP